ncbi:leucine-rich repeat extensin-like protein 6 [Vanessa cardui]|uniref:leucine-rich repeat extensin-like protein 6 n=1 Tax=Vanessa cardui TaxID=171605 RepID=UPI001F129337|nr:leucine-rich repeat extensin-like protein 6 [Vanessa cardui]
MSMHPPIVLILFSCTTLTQCVRLRRIKISSSFDPCNPLYWYPRHIPEYCNFRTTEKPDPAMIPLLDPPPLQPIPLPMPAPIPPPLPVPFPPPLPPQYPPLISGMPPSPFMPFGLPYSNPMFPNYSPAFPAQIGMVPGLPGIVSDDGGINILPFSDVYADVLEKHKNRMVRRRLNKFLDSQEYRHRRRWK